MNRLSAVVFCFVFGCLSFAQNPTTNPEVGQVKVGPDGSSTLKLDGIDIEFDKAGNWNKVYSTYTQPVDFPDRRGIKKAQIIAEEKAKAAIVRQINQKSESNRLVEEVDTTVKNADRTQGTGKDDKFTSTAQRQIVESVREFTRSYSSGNLRGVTVLETGYDEKKEEVWVKVGFSKKTMAIAGDLGRSMAEGTPSSPQSNGSGRPSNDIQTQPSETRTGRQLPE